MKTTADVLQTLSDISEADRLWIINRLSSKARAALLSNDAVAFASPGALVDKPVASSNTNSGDLPSRSKDDQSVLTAASAAQVAAVLEKEPAWVAHALLSDTWHWNQRVRELLPALLREELAAIERTGVVYARKVVDSVVHEVRCALGNDFAIAERSSFARLVESFGSKLATKRLRIGT